MHTPLSQLLVHDARSFGTHLPSHARRLGNPAPEPVTGRLGKGILLLAEQALGVVHDLRAGIVDRIAERTAPWLLRPIPAATVVAFEPAPGDPVVVEAHTTLSSRRADGLSCTFRTTRALRVAPYRVTHAELSVAPGRPAVLLIQFEATGPMPLADAFGADVSFFVDGEREIALELVHALTISAARVSWQSPDWETSLPVPAASLSRPGFGREEALTPDPDGMPAPFGVITEAFICPDKFRFVTAKNALGERPPTLKATLVAQLGGLEQGSWRSQPVTVRAHAVPAVNLFDATAEPMVLDVTGRPQPVRIAGLSAASGGVYAIRDVYATNRAHLRPVRLPEARRLGANVARGEAPAVFATSVDRTDGSVRLHLTPRDGAIAAHTEFGISARVVACNRDRAAKVRAGDLFGRTATPAGPLSYVSVVPASPFFDRPKGADLDLRVLREAGARRGGGGHLKRLRRALALCVPSWGLADEQAFAFRERIGGLFRLEFRVARRKSGPRSIQIGYAYTLTVNESAFRGPGELGLFGTALAEALSRCIPVATFVELTVVGAKTGSESIYVKGMLA